VATTSGTEPPAAASPEPDGFDRLPPLPLPWRHPLRFAARLASLAVGLASLGLVLAILAAIPGLNVLALGVMLEAEGRVARSGRLRDGIPFAAALPRLGSVVVGTWVCLLVVRQVSHAAADAALVDPGGPAARGWAVARAIVTVAVAVHLAGAWFAGGRPGAFLRPLKTLRGLVAAIADGSAAATAARGLGRVVAGFAPSRLAWLGLRGYAGAFVWLLPATLLFSALRDTTRPAGVLVTLLGAVLLGTVLAWLPFLQARFAAEGRLDAFTEVGAVREMWRRAPVVMLLALVALYGLSLPLYLLKIFAAPRDVVFLLTPLFVATIYPARLVVGWAAHAARVRPRRRSLFLRVPVTALLLPALAVYLFLLFFTPAIDALGRRALFDHHAILLPTPF